MLVFLPSIVTFGFPMGCVQRNYNRSHVKESFSSYNSPESLGLSANAMDWNSIRNETRGQREKAWSDTWWPHANKGIADRYILRKNAAQSENLSGREAIFAKFIQQYLKTIEKANPQELALLSPAEKYDFLMNKKQIPQEILNRIEAQTKKFSTSTAEKTLLSLEMKLEKLGEYDESYKTLNAQYASEAKGNALNFTPLLKEGLELNAEMKKYLPLISHDWRLWLDTFSWAHEEEWAWMGICNGWSPAALREKKPLHSVMVKRGDRKVLLTEGDIRGLLSWVWGWQFPNQTLGAGVRCDANESRTIVKNKRIIDGRLCEGAGSRPGRCVAANTIFISKDDPFASVPGRKVTFGFDPQKNATHEAKLKSALGNSFYEAEVKSLQSGGSKTMLIQLTQACRDMNAGLFHAALVDLVARRKTGFVVDADRYTQVWNQPVFAYEMTYLPIRKKDGTTAAAGTPVPAADVMNDPYAAFRSDSSSQIVHVRTKMIYGSENGPLAQYAADGSQETHEELVVDYTLEINRQGKIVGGEWGLLPDTPDVRPLKASNASTPTAPDFIWNYPDNAQPEGELVDLKIVRKIHDCSLKSTPTGRFNLTPYVREPLAYVDCSLD